MKRWNELSLRLMAGMVSWKRSLVSEKGQTMVEYGLILALIAAVVIGVIAALGGHLNDLFSNISNTVAE